MRDDDYNREKFRELLIYIAQRTGDRAFGDIRLNKALHFSDFYAYNRLGHAITGARYQKLPRGPCPRALLPVRQELEHEGAIRVERRRVGNKTATITVAQRPANTGLFTSEELAIVDEVVARLRRLSARQASDISHKESPGWNLVEMGEDIPYSTALISTERPPDHVLARGRELATRFGW
jgi:hypothetical protein